MCGGHRLVRVRKLAFEQLSGGAFGYLVEKVHGLWALVIRQVLAAEGDDLVRGSLRLGLKNDECRDLFAIESVGNPYHSRRSHGGMRVEHVVDLSRVYV